MTRVTGKFQITLPKRLVDAYGIRVGDEVDVVAAGDIISIVPGSARSAQTTLSPQERLRYFDEATRRQRGRNSTLAPATSDERGWTRDELYQRGRSG